MPPNSCNRGNRLRLNFRALTTLWLLIWFYSPSLFAAAETLTLSPNQCVALTQGQTCYVDVTLTWSSPKVGNYCLYSSQQDRPLSCWQQQNQGRLKQEFADQKNITFSLKLEHDTLSEEKVNQQLKITWVHQKRGQPRMWWRIF